MSQNKVLIIIASVVAIILLICGALAGTIYWWTNANTSHSNYAFNYQWTDQDLKNRYSGAKWNKITTSYTSGLTPQISLVEKQTEPCWADYTNSMYLHMSGGLCRTGFWLEDEEGTKIDSREKLKERFAPVENESEAASFVGVQLSDVRIAQNGVFEGNTLTIDDGYLVQFVSNNTFGCGNHEPTGIIFKVTKDGDFERVAEENEPPMRGPAMCVD